jgi:hypothetical protein
MVLKYSHTFNARRAVMGANIKKAMKELNNVKKILPSGETKKATIPTKVRIVDVNSFNSKELLLLLLLLSSPPGGKNMAKRVVVVDVVDDDSDRVGAMLVDRMCKRLHR